MVCGALSFGSTYFEDGPGLSAANCLTTHEAQRIAANIANRVHHSKIGSPMSALGQKQTLQSVRLIDELEACFVVIDSAGQRLAYVHFEEEPARRSAAKLSQKTRR